MRVQMNRGFLTILAVLAAISLLIPIAAFAAAKPKKPETIAIDSSVTIVESPNESEPVRRATEDLMSDLGKVFGSEPQRADDLEDAGPIAILVAERDHVHPGINCAATTDPESFAFSVIRVPGHQALRHIVCLTGADMRGTIYAIYQFSQSVLGVDPMYLWTDKQPEKRTFHHAAGGFRQVISQARLPLSRILPQRRRPAERLDSRAKGEHTGISLKVWDNIFETTLRLKGNIVVPGTWIFPDDAQVHAAAERGLIINQHHAIPLGVNVARWPQDVPYNFSTHPEILERAWTNAVADVQARRRNPVERGTSGVCPTRVMHRSIPACAITIRCLASASAKPSPSR